MLSPVIDKLPPGLLVGNDTRAVAHRDVFNLLLVKPMLSKIFAIFVPVEVVEVKSEVLCTLECHVMLMHLADVASLGLECQPADPEAGEADAVVSLCIEELGRLVGAEEARVLRPGNEGFLAE